MDTDNIVDYHDVDLGAFGEDGAMWRVGRKHFERKLTDLGEGQMTVLRAMAQKENDWLAVSDIGQVGLPMEDQVRETLESLAKDGVVLRRNANDCMEYQLPTTAFRCWLRAFNRRGRAALSHSTDGQSAGHVKNATATRRFQVALSFPGEYRAFVDSLATELASRYSASRVLYDRFHEEEFAQPDLDVKLPRLYLNESELVVVIVCKEYASKEWTGLEWRQIRQHIKEQRSDRIMLMRIDNVSIDEIPGLTKGDGFLDVSGRAASELTPLIQKRLDRLQHGRARG